MTKNRGSHKKAEKKKTDKTQSSQSNFNVVVSKSEKSKSDLAKKYQFELPHSYNQTKLVLLPRDPENLFLYWDFSGETWEWIKSLFEKHERILPKLRIFVLDQDEFYEIDVKLESKKWHLFLPVAGETVYAELGLMDESATFHLIAKSNSLKMPRNAPSKVIDPNWVPINLGKVYERYSIAGSVGSSERVSSLEATSKIET